MNEATPAPQEGALLPDFTMYFRDGRVLYRRELKGRSHAAIYFPPELQAGAGSAIQASLAARIPAWHAARSMALIVLSVTDAARTVDLPIEPVIDHHGLLRARFGVGPGGALFVADRYGEIALRADGVYGESALPLDEVMPTLELLEMRCSL